MTLAASVKSIFNLHCFKAANRCAVEESEQEVTTDLPYCRYQASLAPGEYS